MYCTKNYRTKKELKEAVASGKEVTVFQPGPFGGSEPQSGRVALEGPHYPEPHRWYASAELKEGRVVKVS